MFFGKKHHNVKLGLGSICTSKCDQNHSYPGYDLSPHFDVQLKFDLSPTWLFNKLTLTGTNTLAYYSNYCNKLACLFLLLSASLLNNQVRLKWHNKV